MPRHFQGDFRPGINPQTCSCNEFLLRHSSPESQGIALVALVALDLLQTCGHQGGLTQKRLYASYAQRTPSAQSLSPSRRASPPARRTSAWLCASAGNFTFSQNRVLQLFCQGGSYRRLVRRAMRSRRTDRGLLYSFDHSLVRPVRDCSLVNLRSTYTD
jgi:hypothetical protein